jgi:hypothetical protein
MSKTQLPSEYANGMTTTSPTFTLRTSAPTASTAVYPRVEHATRQTVIR